MLVVGAVGVAITVSLLTLGLSASRTSFALVQSKQSQMLANACAEDALQAIRADNLYVGDGGFALGAGNCTHTVVGADAVKTITARGTVGGVVRKVKVTTTATTPYIIIGTWKEVPDF